MGGHGGLNILPQKKWNVYNFDNREKVRKDEEAAAKEEQLKREQSRKRDSESRLLQLRRARGLDPESSIEAPSSSSSAVAAVESPSSEPKSDSKHINLFDGIRIFDPIEVVEKKKEDEGSKRKKMKKEEVRVVGPEDEKYRLGYGVAGKGVKAPWYAVKPEKEEGEEREEGRSDGGEKTKAKVSGKKTLEELREERLKREKTEKERERALLSQKRGGSNGRYQRMCIQENIGLGMKIFLMDILKIQVINQSKPQLHKWGQPFSKKFFGNLINQNLYDNGDAGNTNKKGKVLGSLQSLIEDDVVGIN